MSVRLLICDTSRMLVSIGFEELHARWQKGAPVDMVTITDGTKPLPPSHGIVIGPTLLERPLMWGDRHFKLNLLPCAPGRTSFDSGDDLNLNGEENYGPDFF